MSQTKIQSPPSAKKKRHKRSYPGGKSILVTVGNKSFRLAPAAAKIMSQDLIVKMLNGYGAVASRAMTLGRPERLTFEVTPEGSFESVEAPAAVPGDLQKAMAAAKARGQTKIAEILKGDDMLTAPEFGALVGISHETVNRRRSKGEILGLQGETRSLKYPSWQVTDEGLVLPGLVNLIEALGGQPWTVYRFLKTAHAELGGETALDAMKAGKLDAVLNVAKNQKNGVFS